MSGNFLGRSTGIVLLVEAYVVLQILDNFPEIAKVGGIVESRE